MPKTYIHWNKDREISNNMDNIEIKVHVGTLYVVDMMNYISGMPVFLLEHEEYGDEAACLIVREDGSILMDNVWNGFDDLEA